MHEDRLARPTVAFHTLGCKVNQHDSDMMAALFQTAGYTVGSFSEAADVYVINTCTVTHLSDRKSRQMIRRAVGQNPDAVVVVCGCYAQTAAAEVAQIPGVDLIIGTNERHRVVEAVESFRETREQGCYLPTDDDLYYFEQLPHERVSDMTRAYVKVQEGCNQFCTYCIIPYARGPVRSRNMADTVEEVRQLAAQGYREIILTGIHIGAFGTGKKDEAGDLTELCRRLLAETDISRLRLGSVEVTEVTPALIELMASSERMARHLHLPLQAGSDRTLQRMNRPYRTEDFRTMVETLRSRMPDLAITTDCMVGFPGESEDDFRDSLIFCNEMAFSDMHIFKYSVREGTPAARMTDQIEPQEKDRRARLMADVATKNRQRYQEDQLGQVLSLLVEETDRSGHPVGHTSNYLKVRLLDAAEKGEIVTVRIERLDKELLEARRIAEDV